MNTPSKTNRGGSSILAVFFVSLFSVLAVSFAAVSNLNVQVSNNHKGVLAAQMAAESGLAYAHHLLNGYKPMSTANNAVSVAEATTSFNTFCTHLRNDLALNLYANAACTTAWSAGVLTVYLPARSVATGSPERFSLSIGLLTDAVELKHKLVIASTGATQNITRRVELRYSIQKEANVLKYAVASRGRMWLTGDSTIHGPIFSAWSRTDISPFNITSDSRVEGTVNTVITRQAIEDADDYQLETLNADGLPMDTAGNPLGTNYEDRFYSADDELQGYHEGVNYDVDFNNMPGMNISDYNTDAYKVGLATIGTAPSTVVEFYPHAVGDYSYPSTGTPTSTSCRKLTRSKYENQTYTDAKLPANRNAVFKNCTFNGKLYIECNTNGSTNYNNVRFDNCTFNGAIITNVPQTFKWQYNCLYFTGAATFNNQSTMQEATILAPHFNVNLGNNNPVAGDNNQLTGAIIGGIVDIRGNADIYGTIISMCDTSAWSSGYVSNIGATLNDGGSETIEASDVGTINITPDPDQLLPSGITTPIIFDRDSCSYVSF